MAQHDYVIANGTGAAVRSDLNNALAAIVSQNSGAVEPTTTYAYMPWADTGSSPPVFKIRNAANNGWITLYELDGTFSVEAGSASSPGLYFTGDINTGIFSAGADQFNIATNGVERVEWGASEVVFNDGGANYDFRIEGDTNSSLFFVDASAEAVGIGNNAPGNQNGAASQLVVGNTSANNGITILTGTSNDGVLNFNDGDNNSLRGYLIYEHSSDSLRFGSAGSERARIDSSGRLLVGTSTARSNFFNTTWASQIQLEGTSDQASALSLVASNNANEAGVLLLGNNRGSVGGNTVVQNGDAIGIISFQGNDGSQMVEGARIQAIINGAPGADDLPTALVFSTTADGASSPTQAMVINSTQDTLFTKSTASLNSTGWYGVYANPTVGALSISRNGNNVLAFFHASNANGLSGSPVGTVSITTTATTYATSSDYRLKENVVPLTGAIDRLNQLQVRRFNFIADPDKTVDGFLAHEAQEVVPECATGTKDEVDADGNPVYQGIDQSKLVPLLTAALQEALQKIEVLEQRLTDAGIA
jgi:hypothetical protein